MSIDAGILAVQKSTSALWAMFHLAATIVALFATAIYFAERGKDVSPRRLVNLEPETDMWTIRHI